MITTHDHDILVQKCVDHYGTFLFSNIAIETSNYCNRSCSFCPVSVTRKPVNRLSEQTVLKIFDELHDLGYVGQICFNWYNEPLADVRLADFISIARNSCPRSHIYFSTNGDLLNERMLTRLIKAGISLVRVSQYDGKIADNIHPLVDSPYVHVHVKQSGDLWNTRGGLITSLVTRDTPLIERCTRPDEQLIIDSYGNVPLCCNDYHASHKMGNINISTLAEIWNNRRFDHARSLVRIGDRTGIPVCNKCNEPDVPYATILRNFS